MSVSDNDNIKLDDTLPNLNEEENPEEYINCSKYPLIEDENEEEDDHSYFDYENEHLTDKEASDGENQVKQYGDSDTNDVRFFKYFLEKNEDNIRVKKKGVETTIISYF